MKKNNKKLISISAIVILLTTCILLGNLANTITLTKKNGIQTAQEIEKIEENKGTYYLSSSVDGINCKYLSDIEYIKDKSSVEWGSITLDGNLETQHNNGLISLIINGQKKYFLKGISAHATSTLIYDLKDEDFDYFSAFIGVDESRGTNGNGVKFEISTSQDGNTWNVIEDAVDKNKVFRGNENALLVTVDISDARYLKLYCNNNGNNASDHAVYANAKLYKKGYEEKEAEYVDFIDTVENYDKILKNESLDDQIGKDELTLLRREFVSRVGFDLLQVIVNQNEDYKETVKWLMNNQEMLHLYILGGEPDGGSYYNSIKELSRLYKEYKDDFEDKTKTDNKWYPELTKGDVFKKMAISLSLTHATKVGYWAQIDHPSNRSDSVKRYKIYKELYNDGKFKVSDRQDQTDWYEALTVEEMRYVMNNITDDEELIWFNDYTQKRINENPNQEEKYLQPHTYIAYVWPNFEFEKFHDPNMKEYWDKLFEGIFTKYHVTYSNGDDHVYKAWMSMRNEFGTGAVCGGISKLGCHIRAAHGAPASVIGQPGHAAIIYYRKYDNGDGYWTIDNDVSGWAQSGKSEKLSTRMPLGWGNDSYVDGYAATYIVLAQEAINDNEKYEEAEKILMTAKLYENDVKLQEEIYRKALKVQNINIDAWWGLINAYKADSTKKEEDYYKLAVELGEALKPFPLPMKNLLDQIKEKMPSVEYSFKYTLLETKLLNEGKEYNSTDVVSQPGITRTVASYLLGQTDTTLASFSFDGTDSNKIVLSSKYDGTGVRWDYSLDGKKTWKEVEFTPDEAHKWKLTKKEIESITAENDIYVHIVGLNYNEENLYKIDIEDQEPLTNVYANDLENRLVGINLNTHWRYSENDDWTSYNIASPNLTGNKTVQIRQGASGTKLASSASEIYKFTEDNQPDTRKYIRVSDLEITEYSSQSIDGKRPYYAPNAIDGNLYTLWHTDFRYDVIKEGITTFLTIKLNEPKYISALEFVQTKYLQKDPDEIKGATIYVSTDGEEWTKAGKIENCTEYGKVHGTTFDKSVYGQYVKVEFETYNMFASVSMINLYEDLTKIDRTKPTAGIYYSPKEPTSGYVIARLDNPSTEITVTNNDGNDTYIFTDNGKFTFEFEDKNGNKGTATAEVNWIDKSNPSADVKYQLDGDKKLFIILDNISEDVYLLDKDNNKVCFIEVKDNKVYRMSYIDSNGNVYKIVEQDEDGNISKITYTNTTKDVSKVATYVTTITNGEVTDEEFFDQYGAPVTVNEAEKEILEKLQLIKANPLEYTFEDSGEYEFKLLDKANNIAYKTIKVDYLEDNNIIASDVSYDITKLTNKNVVATINPYMIDSDGKKLNVELANDSDEKIEKVEDKGTDKVTYQYTFEKNGKFVFKYKDASDNDDIEIKEHKAEVDWIDKVAPTAKIRYSTKEKTNGIVTANLTDESETIVITNNSMNREYAFDKNGNFTFKFKDEAGNQGEAVAAVNWIEELKVGDVNADGKITATDLILVKRHLVAGKKEDWVIKEDKLKLVDINEDNKITATDLLLLQRLVLSQIKEK